MQQTAILVCRQLPDRFVDPNVESRLRVGDSSDNLVKPVDLVVAGRGFDRLISRSRQRVAVGVRGPPCSEAVRILAP
jgi:hypothetical protein